MSFLIHNEAFIPNKSQSYELYDFFDNQIKYASIHKHVIVVPTRKIVRNLKKYLAKQYSVLHKKAINNIFIYNLEDFIKQLSSCLDIIQDKNIITEGIQLMLIEQAINQSDLKYYKFQDNYLKLDVARKIASVINGLRMDGVGFQNEQNEFLIFDSRKSNDIDLIHQNYNKLLGTTLLDIPNLMNNLLANLSHSGTLEKLSKILTEKYGIESINLIGFSDFRQVELQILSKFKSLTIPFIINLDYSEFAGPLFGNFQKILKHFIEHNFKMYSSTSINVDDDKITNKLSYHLFDEKKEKKFTNITNNLTIIECQNIVDEVQYITKMVKYMNLVKKIPLSEIAIVTRKPDDYASLFFNSFKSENIPVNVTHRKNINQSVIVRNILLILKYIEGNFSFEQLKLLFQSKFIIIDEIDNDNFLEVIRILKLRNTNLNFQNEFIKNRAVSFLSYINSMLNTELDKYSRKDYETLKVKLEKFLLDIEVIKSKFDKFDKKNSIEELKRFHLQILKDFGIIRSILSQIEQIQINKEKYNLTEYNDLIEAVEAENNALNVFTNLIEKLMETLPILEYETISISDLLDRLEIATMNEKYQIREKENFGVTVTSIDQIRMLPYKIKILCGTIDGSLPLTYNVEKFLGKELVESKYEHYRAEKVLFYQFLEDVSWLNYQSQKYITYPKLTNNSINTISPLIDSLIRNTDINEKGKFIRSTDDNELLPINRIIASNTEYFKFISTYKLGDQIKYDTKINELINLVQNQLIKQNVANQIDLKNSYRNKLQEKYYTIGDFENYTQCPYYYYLKRILLVDLTKEYEIKLKPVEIGNIFHKILFEFYTQLQNKISSNNTVLKPIKLEQVEWDTYKQMILDITNQELSNPLYDHPFVKLHTNKLLSNRPSINPLLNWLHKEINEHSKSGLLPAFFEFPITIEVQNTAQSIDKIVYTIKIDRIDVEIKENNLIDFSVVDYKIRSNNVKDKDIIEQKSFQIPIYMVSTIEHFKSKGLNFEPIEGSYYNLLDFNKNKRKVLDTKSKNNPINIKAILDKSKSKTFEIRDQIKNGFFAITTDEKNCKYCNMTPICRRKTVNQ